VPGDRFVDDAPAGGGERDQLAAAVVGVGTALVNAEKAEVRFRGQTGKHLLTASISAFGPSRSLTKRN